MHTSVKVLKVLVATGLLSIHLIAGATVIAAREGVGRQGFIAAPSAISFNLSDTFENVAIEAIIDDSGNNNGIPGNGTVYLTTSIGPGTSLADEIASVLLTDLPFHPDATTAPYVPLFSGLSLVPDTYYLVLFSGPSNPELRWLRDFNDTTRVESTAAGVTIGDDFANTAAAAAYPPATDVVATQPWQLFRVSGDLVNDVPVPSSALLLATALALIAVLRPRRVDVNFSHS